MSFYRSQQQTTPIREVVLETPEANFNAQSQTLAITPRKCLFSTWEKMMTNLDMMNVWYGPLLTQSIVQLQSDLRIYFSYQPSGILKVRGFANSKLRN